MLDKAMVSVFSLFMILTVIVASCSIISDLSRKIVFDELSREALLRMDMHGGMNEEISESLRSGLEKLNFKDIQITGTGNSAYGENLFLAVTASFESSRITSLFGGEKKKTEIIYERQIISRRIHNLS